MVECIRQVVGSRYLTFALRLVLGGAFIAAALSKLPHRVEFAELVVSYGLLPEAVARGYGLALPWAELAIGCLLILGLLSRGAAGAAILATITFIVANSINLYRGVESCGCFGEVLLMPTRGTILLDVLLLAMAVQILFHKKEFLSLDSYLGR